MKDTRSRLSKKFYSSLLTALFLGCSGSEAPSAVETLATSREAATAVRLGMTWTVLGQQNGYVHVGGDSQSGPYSGDTAVTQFQPILCVQVDNRAAPGGIAFDFYNGWLRGEVRATPPVPGMLLSSQAQADTMCADNFGSGWRMAEFHDGRYRSDFSAGGGWSFWGAGQLPAGTRFWVAIKDQPANPWNSAGDMPTTVKFIPSEAPVPGQFIVMFSESTPSDQITSLANNLISAYGGSIIDVLPAAQMFTFSGSDAQARAMSQDSRVESVEQDSYGQEYTSWNQDRVDQRNLPLDGRFTPSNNGSGVNIYILDTGFRRTHQEFGGRASQAVDFIRFLGQRDDCNGHGTAVGSLAGGATLGVAPGANLISVRIAGCGGNAYNPAISVFSSTIVAGLNWVAMFHTKPAVANVSYGFPPGFWRRWFNSATPMDRAARTAVRAGVTVIAAAGNEGRNADRSSPARDGSVISVSATDLNDQRASFANYGKVDLFAPGVSVQIASLASDTQTTTGSGTSYAAPMVAGATAVYLHDHPTASPQEVRNSLQNGATPNVVGNAGSGSANRLLYVSSVMPATHAGMTWVSRQQRTDGVVLVGNDSQTNAYNGDTPATTALPMLCLLVDNSPVPTGITPSFNPGWARGQVRTTPPIRGTELVSRAAADSICAANFGTGWRMAEFHDGRYGAALSSSGGWSYWARGTIPVGTRLWVAINDQTANPWGR
ncbi:S8 family peptidase [Vitiosangium sp. GDMCC 1.1324]|uniref:S8 family peptidase n=1 Tax=Vitiosangium sp. (strain GDMCC 1.1324) TaxID=2138576 RepID=UPI00130E4867|nr:S8 family peptidase [Vitiosangium sp. GDMCC 1.1324]